MTDAPKTVRNGDHYVVEINGEWHVLFEPADLPFHYLSIARFQTKDRALGYAEIEQMMLDDAPSYAGDVGAIKPLDKPISPNSLLGVIDDWFGRQMYVDDMSRLNVHRVHSPGPTPSPPAAAAPLPLPETAPEPEAPVAPPAAPAIPIQEPDINPSEGQAPAETSAISPPPGGEAGEEAPKSAPAAITNRDPVGHERWRSETNADRLHAAMLAKRDPDNTLRGKMDDLAKWSNVPRGSIDAAVYDLTRKGLIDRDGPKGGPYVYRVLKDESGKALTANRTSIEAQLSIKPLGVNGKIPESKPSLTEPPFPHKPFAEPLALPKAQVADLPGRLQIAGRYIIVGRHTIMLTKVASVIAASLVEKWGEPLPTDDLINSVATHCNIKNGEARGGFGTAIDHLNKDIECTGLMAEKSAEGWTLRIFDEARMIA